MLQIRPIAPLFEITEIIELHCKLISSIIQTSVLASKNSIVKMTSERSIFDDSNIQWERTTSKLGKPYAIGRTKLDNALEKESPPAAAAAATAKKDFGIQIDLPVGSDDSWKDTPDNVRDRAAISRWKLHTIKAIGGKYTLEITNSAHYDYHFYDGTGDSYRLNTYVNGDHYVSYDSQDPALLFVTGS